MKFINIISFFKNTGFLKKTLYAFTIALLFILLSLIFLNIYTRHGNGIMVPDLRGKTLEEAELQIRKSKLRFVVYDSVYNNEYPKGTVVDQVPRAMSEVKKKRKIYVTMNAVGEEKITMPNLVGITLREARTKMENEGLREGELIYVFDIAKNVVLEQKYRNRTINEGDSIIKGSFIDLILGKGLSNITTMVPDLFGLSIEEAKIKASDRYFSLGHITYDSTVINTADSLDARIFMQEPEHHVDIRAPLGTPIYVWVTVDSTKLFDQNTNDSVFTKNAFSDDGI